MEDDLLPSDFFLPYGALIDMDSESDPEAEMDYTAEEEEEEEDDELLLGSGDLGGELPGLLLDAEMDVADMINILDQHGRQ